MAATCLAVVSVDAAQVGALPGPSYPYCSQQSTFSNQQVETEAAGIAVVIGKALLVLVPALGVIQHRHEEAAG
jgi:hypothetical protein